MKGTSSRSYHSPWHSNVASSSMWNELWQRGGFNAPKEIIRIPNNMMPFLSVFGQGVGVPGRRRASGAVAEGVPAFAVLGNKKGRHNVIPRPRDIIDHSLLKAKRHTGPTKMSSWSSTRSMQRRRSTPPSTCL